MGDRSFVKQRLGLTLGKIRYNRTKPGLGCGLLAQLEKAAESNGYLAIRWIRLGEQAIEIAVDGEVPALAQGYSPRLHVVRIWSENRVSQHI
jgi:hypothetical protein